MFWNRCVSVCFLNASFKVLCFEVLSVIPTKFINFQLEFLTQFDLFIVLVFGFVYLLLSLLVVFFTYCIDCKFHFFYFAYFIVLLVVKKNFPFDYCLLTIFFNFMFVCQVVEFFLLINLCLLTFMLIDLLVLVNYLSFVFCYFDCCNVLFQFFFFCFLYELYCLFICFWFVF